nr:winged helix-turn-helix domain-containing protein [Amycolatopsis granulosa]
MKSGARIPSEHDLVQRYGVSRPTVHRALVELVNERLAITVKNKGRYVRESGPASADEHDDHAAEH